MPSRPELPPAPTAPNPAPAVLSFNEADALVKERAGDGPTLQNDPAFPPEGDPVKVPGARAYATIVKRSIPLVVVQNSWSIQGAKNALASHSMGVFETSGQLAISIRGDPRVTAALGSLRAGYFGREVRFRAANNSRAAKEVLDAWMAHWPQFEAGSDLAIMSDYERLMGWSDGQLVWDTSGTTWLPYVRYWWSRFSYWNWDIRKFVAITQDGTFAIASLETASGCITRDSDPSDAGTWARSAPSRNRTLVGIGHGVTGFGTRKSTDCR